MSRGFVRHAPGGDAREMAGGSLRAPTPAVGIALTYEPASGAPSIKATRASAGAAGVPPVVKRPSCTRGCSSP